MASLESFKGFRHPSDQDPGWEGSPQPKIENDKCVFNWLLDTIQCFKPMFFFFFFFLSEKSPVTDPPISEIFQYIFLFLNPSLRTWDLRPSLTVSNSHRDLCPSNICTGDICQYWEYFSWYWPNFDLTLKVGSCEKVEEYLSCYWPDFDQDHL